MAASPGGAVKVEVQDAFSTSFGSPAWVHFVVIKEGKFQGK